MMKRNLQKTVTPRQRLRIRKSVMNFLWNSLLNRLMSSFLVLLEKANETSNDSLE